MPVTEIPELSADQVTVLLSGESGAGQVLADARNSRNWTQDDLAARIGVTRSAVAQWEVGNRWPKGHTLDKLLVLLSPASTVVRDKRLEARVTQQELTQILHELEEAQKDEIDRADALMAYAYPRVLSTLILRATGAPGCVADTKSIELFFTHKREVGEEKRRREVGTMRNVTEEQARWASGDIYEKRKPTTGSGSTSDNKNAETHDPPKS